MTTSRTITRQVIDTGLATADTPVMANNSSNTHITMRAAGDQQSQ
jgi:hypothetical protein